MKTSLTSIPFLALGFTLIAACSHTESPEKMELKPRKVNMNVRDSGEPAIAEGSCRSRSGQIHDMGSKGYHTCLQERSDFNQDTPSPLNQPAAKIGIEIPVDNK